MKAQRNQTGRRFFLFRRPPGGTLPRTTIIIYSLLILAAAGLIASCGRTLPDRYDTAIIDVPPDSSSFTVCFRMEDYISESPHGIQRLDLFIYDADGAKELLDYRRYDFLPDSVLLYGTGQERIMVAIANSGFDFNTEALSRFDSIEMIVWNFEDDRPETPVMSGTCEIAPGGKSSITLTPLMARIQLGEISNSMKGYLRLENPRLYLDNMNASAELLRTVGFRPSETVDDPPRIQLPYDIGIFPQNPGTEVFCYPNDTPGTIGTPATALVLEGEISGVTHSFSTPIPSVARNSSTRIDLNVSGPDSFESKIY